MDAPASTCARLAQIAPLDSPARNWRRIAEERLGQLAAIARIGAEPPEAVLAIIGGKDPGPAAGTNDTSTICHHSVADLRRELTSDAEAWREAADAYFKHRREDEKAAEAYAGARMAGVYAYSLAAVLGVAERELGPQTARLLADIADEILENGDEGDLNADVKPGTPLPPPTPAEQAAGGQLALGQPEPVTAQVTP